LPEIMHSTLDLGDIRITWLAGGEFELDGGTMYGAVPKILWDQKNPADKDNYIRLLNAPLLVQTASANILIDTGLGNKFSDKQKKIFRICREWSVLNDLADLGLSRTDIDLVLLTHCDFDHAGGVVMRGDAGEDELTFPNAKHVVQQREWEDVLSPDIRAVHTYWPENFAGIVQSGLLQIVDGTTEISPGITLRLTGGHTRGFQLVEINGSSGQAVHFGDLFPTHTHANPLWIMAYDNFPLDVIHLKEQLFPTYIARNWWFTFYHDIAMKACRLDQNNAVLEEIP